MPNKTPSLPLRSGPDGLRNRVQYGSCVAESNRAALEGGARVRLIFVLRCTLGAILLAAAVSFDCLAQQQNLGEIQDQLARGRYMVVTGHCNNCHTANYQAREGDVPESEWLTGRKVGHRGPWGTTYPTNLRLNVHAMSEAEWVSYSGSLKTRPGMAWWSLRDTSTQDLTAMYRFIKSLGPSDKPSHPFIPAGATPEGAVIQLVAPQAKPAVKPPERTAATAERPLAESGTQPSVASNELLARGQYMIVTGHCNNCHTQDYGRLEARVPEREWLKGSEMGHRGEWGTTFPTNLRINVAAMTEEQWVTYVKSTKALPPMPWWALHQTEMGDLRAMYQFIRALGPPGEPSPTHLPPGEVSKPPYAQWPTSLAE